MVMKAVSSFFIPEKNFIYWLKKNWYYHAYLKALYRFMIPVGSSILQVNCKTGFLLEALRPSQGVGVEADSELLSYAQQQYFQQRFYSKLSEINDATFDYIILSSTPMEVEDIQNLFKDIRPFCHSRTRIIIDTYNCLWEPILWLAQKMRLKRPTLLKNWINARDIKSFLNLENYEVISESGFLLFPLYIPLLSWFLNSFVAHFPLINDFCLLNVIIARPHQPIKEEKEYTVSVIVPCKNEKGNIAAAIERCPVMGKSTELIFVEGGSQDGTLQEIQRLMLQLPHNEKNISYAIQAGKGKGDAVRLGFARAQGDILMILDADLTVPPEELPKFFEALVRGKGEFINGSRLVYGMEDNAMRFLNLCANYLFGIGFSWLLGQPIKDTLCGTKVLFKREYELIQKNRAIFGDFDPFGDFDLLFGAAKQHLKIVEMPVHYKNRTYGQTQISRFRHGLLLLHMSWVAFKKFKNFKIEK